MVEAGVCKVGPYLALARRSYPSAAWEFVECVSPAQFESSGERIPDRAALENIWPVACNQSHASSRRTHGRLISSGTGLFLRLTISNEAVGPRVALGRQPPLACDALIEVGEKPAARCSGEAGHELPTLSGLPKPAAGPAGSGAAQACRAGVPPMARLSEKMAAIRLNSRAPPRRGRRSRD